MKTVVSIVVCTFNRCESLRETLKALKAQEGCQGLVLEILVIDNNSNDRTRAVVDEERASSPWEIRYVFESQQGLSHARNRGILEAKGEIIAFTDDDVLPEPKWAQALAEAIVAHHANSAGGKILPLWSGKPPHWSANAKLRQIFWGALALLDRGPEPIIASDCDVNIIFGANMAFQKEVFDELGFFDTHLGRKGKQLLSGDDTEIVRRVLKFGRRVVYTPTAVVHHKVPKERTKLNYIRRWKFNQGRSEVLLGQPKAHGILKPWFIRVCLADLMRALWSYGKRDYELGIKHELIFWIRLGRLTETVRLLWHPDQQSA